ncbi:hypothetical protein H257_16912 [Aphanomyces astaci]|uniref:Uncharacterized protein n=1 Tax=Aphanomyces astaci TaxID=112090 RepID=W4FGR4_APHAT|nr:hypothetical protein H257_16912 [Aphanomyces astaci]ETV66702.1 hypothetical protein H257_16912 [Aphanomyces astaci]|eukprot:XP_009843827.1 hypothetical protein H257_16912 [Aphanomyces astaci]
MGLQREMEQATEQSMAVSIARPKRMQPKLPRGKRGRQSESDTRVGLFETQGRWLVCAFEHMTILEIPLAEFVNWKNKMRERISD